MDGKKILVSFIVSFQMLIMQIMLTSIMPLITNILPEEILSFNWFSMIIMLIFMIIFICIFLGILFILFLGLRSVQHIYLEQITISQTERVLIYYLIPAAAYIFLFWVILKKIEMTNTIIAIIGAIAIIAVFEKGFQKWQKPVLDKKPYTKN